MQVMENLPIEDESSEFVSGHVSMSSCGDPEPVVPEQQASPPETINREFSHR